MWPYKDDVCLDELCTLWIYMFDILTQDRKEITRIWITNNLKKYWQHSESESTFRPLNHLYLKLVAINWICYIHTSLLTYNYRYYLKIIIWTKDEPALNSLSVLSCTDLERVWGMNAPSPEKFKHSPISNLTKSMPSPTDSTHTHTPFSLIQHIFPSLDIFSCSAHYPLLPMRFRPFFKWHCLNAVGVQFLAN